jgi:riboflavin kinase/FMN adenylyltransferase
MLFVDDISTLPPAAKGLWLALGNFDGVHRGHQTLLAEVQARAQAAKKGGGVLTFAPHPRLVFQPEAEPFLLTQQEQKYDLLTAYNLDAIIVLPFTQDFSTITAHHFMEEVLSKTLNVAGLVVGYDFLFGYQRQGNTKLLAAWGAAKSIPVVIMPPLLSADGQRPYSSSAIRHAIRAGDMRAAAQGLGRPWQVTGTVIRGAQRGRILGFPTANLALHNYVTPQRGVYVVTVTLPDGARKNGVANYGIKPSVNGDAPLLEVHLFDYNADLYGASISVAFHHFLRPEQRFASLDALKAQISLDANNAQKYLLNASLFAT